MKNIVGQSYHKKKQASIQKRADSTFLYDSRFKSFFQKAIQRINKFIVAVKYWCYKWTVGSFKNGKIPYLKIAVVCFVVFLFTQRDFYFQFRMQMPEKAGEKVEVAPQSVSQTAIPKAERLGIANPLDWIKTEESLYAKKLDKADVEAYIKRFAKVAIMEQKKFGILASVKMAQAILESQAGKLTSLSEHNNHFGQPLADKPYKSAWENWRAHSYFVVNNSTAFEALKANGTDYKKWANGMQTLGYNAPTGYAQKLIELIETYEIYRLDNIAKK